MNEIIPSIASNRLQEIIATSNFYLIAPHLIVTMGAIILMLVSLIKGRMFRNNAVLAMLVLAAAAVCGFPKGAEKVQFGFNNMILADMFSGISVVLFAMTGILVIMLSHNYLKKRGTDVPEYYTLLLFAISGMMFMTSAADLMILYIGLEILSVSLYVMAAIDIRDVRSTEAGLKYFLMSVFASAFLLFGVAFVYGATGSTGFTEIKLAASGAGFNHVYFLYIGALLILAGIAFKISAVPFHQWTPDVYQGAPLAVTAFLSTGPKIASFLFLFKLFAQFQGAQPYPALIEDVVVALAVITMIVGNLLALNQDDIKRMLAFSSVTHMGYVLTAFASRSNDAISAAMFYFTAYIFMNLGVFAILSVMSRNNDKNLTVDNFRGMSHKKPLAAFLLLTFLVSLAGVPPMIGFAAKFFVFSAVIHAKMYMLAVIGILNAVVSAYYYLRIIINMYLKDPSGDESENAIHFSDIKFSFPESIAISVCYVAVVFLGLQPAYIIQWFEKIIL